jgi:amidase
MPILERDTLGAFCRHTHVELDGATDGPLAGLTFGLKDIFDVAGHHTGFGSPDWLRTHEPAERTASVVTRLLAAGATLVGKTHTEEMAFSLTGENGHYGTPVNPAAPLRVPGGSSSGSASAVAGGLADFALGSDTGGSVRAPASFCGIFGMRPTHGRIPLDGACPLAPSFDTCGWFAREAGLLARVGAVLLGARETGDGMPAGAPPGTGAGPAIGRLLIATDAFAHALPEAAAALAPAVARVEAAFGRAEPVVLSEEGLRAWFEVFRTLQAAEIWRVHGDWVHTVQPTFGPRIAPRFAAVAATDPATVPPAAAAREAIRARLDALLAGDAVLLMPTMPDIAPLLNEPPETAVPVRERALALLCAAGLGGLPQLSLPAASLRGCPLGLSLVAARGNDELLLAVAQQLG